MKLAFKSRIISIDLQSSALIHVSESKFNPVGELKVRTFVIPLSESISEVLWVGFVFSKNIKHPYLLARCNEISLGLFKLNILEKEPHYSFIQCGNLVTFSHLRRFPTLSNGSFHVTLNKLILLVNNRLLQIDFDTSRPISSNFEFSNAYLSPQGALLNNNNTIYMISECTNELSLVAKLPCVYKDCILDFVVPYRKYPEFILKNYSLHVDTIILSSSNGNLMRYTQSKNGCCEKNEICTLNCNDSICIVGVAEEESVDVLIAKSHETVYLISLFEFEILKTVNHVEEVYYSDFFNHSSDQIVFIHIDGTHSFYKQLSQQTSLPEEAQNSSCKALAVLQRNIDMSKQSIECITKKITVLSSFFTYLSSGVFSHKTSNNQTFFKPCSLLNNILTDDIPIPVVNWSHFIGCSEVETSISEDRLSFVCSLKNNLNVAVTAILFESSCEAYSSVEIILPQSESRVGISTAIDLVGGVINLSALLFKDDDVKAISLTSTNFHPNQLLETAFVKDRASLTSDLFQLRLLSESKIFKVSSHVFKFKNFPTFLETKCSFKHSTTNGVFLYNGGNKVFMESIVWLDVESTTQNLLEIFARSKAQLNVLTAYFRRCLGEDITLEEYFSVSHELRSLIHDFSNDVKMEIGDN